jgi:hypothetical protein
MVEADHAKGQRPIEAVVAAHETLVAHEREFARATKAYNSDIAEYVMAVADLALPDDQFAVMLIGTPMPWQPQPQVPIQPAGLVSPAAPPSGLVSPAAPPSGLMSPAAAPSGLVPPQSGLPPPGFVPVVPAPAPPVAAP